MEKVKHKKEKSANIETGIPSAPTMEDFYYDPGIRDHETVRYNTDCCTDRGSSVHVSPIFTLNSFKPLLKYGVFSDPLGVANFTNPENPICDNLHDLAITGNIMN